MFNLLLNKTKKMSKVIVHLAGGVSYETTENALENIQRLFAGKITGIERPNEVPVLDLSDSIDDGLIIDITSNNDVDKDVDNVLPTLEELLKIEKELLKTMANALAEKKGITKVNGRSGVEKLAEYIFDNQK